ncbi:MAG: response regulator transcription factor [Frankiaceae bacterium]
MTAAIANAGRGTSAAAVAEQLARSSGRAAGCVVAVATPDATSGTRELRALAAAGLTAVPVRHAWALPAAVAKLRPDLVLLDIAICHTAVLDVLAELASLGAPAVILCGSLPDPATRAALLYAGADDCVLAPYLVEELVARVLAVLRRTSPGVPPTSRLGSLTAGSMCIDLDSHSVAIGGAPVALTLIEYRLLTYLLRHRGIALSRERLLADVWGYTIGTPDTVTVHIRRLRSKIEVDPSRPVWVETVWGLGYRFSAEPAERTSMEPIRRPDV